MKFLILRFIYYYSLKYNNQFELPILRNIHIFIVIYVGIQPYNFITPQINEIPNNKKFHENSDLNTIYYYTQ